MNTILESCKFVVDNSQQVKINHQKIDEFCECFTEGDMTHWSHEAPFDITQLSLKEQLHFLLILDALNFSYRWTPKREIIYKGEKWSGSYGMIAALGRAVEKGIPILDPEYFAHICSLDLQDILEGTIEIPLFEERLHILKEVWIILVQKYNGDLSNLIIESNNDSQKLLNSIIESFPSFADEAQYKGTPIYFYKRAQLLVTDINQSVDWHPFNISEITACADYKLPFVLRRLGILSYSNHLADTIDNQREIKEESEEEIEIRANTVWAIELMKQKIKKRLPQVDSLHINNHIWRLGQEKLKNDKPYHHTRTTAY